MAMEDAPVGRVDESQLSTEELEAIGNRFLELIAPTLSGGQSINPEPRQAQRPQQQQPQRQGMQQAPSQQRQGQQQSLPMPQQLKKFSAGMAPKVKSVLEGYQRNMGQQQRPGMMMPPQYMQQQMPQQMPYQQQMPNIYNNLQGRPQFVQGPYQAFNPYMVG